MRVSMYTHTYIYFLSDFKDVLILLRCWSPRAH